MAPDIKSTGDGNGATHPPVDSSQGQRCPLDSSTKQENGDGCNLDSKSLIPTMYVDGWAARVHDDVNLVVLAIMALMAAWSMWKQDSWTQYALTQFAAGYMVLDACWILCNPAGVKSPKTVLGHHVATLLVLVDPLFQPQHALYTACALLVEFNTLLLILRRRVAWGRYLEIPFALSWVALRLAWYPFLAFYFAMCAFPESLTPIYPEPLVKCRESVEGERATQMFLGSYLAWVGICLFQGWWSCALAKTYSRPSVREKKFL